ncbi:uncharacterized protein BCR38DRAFT_450242 [Pseudomassariella vexata]|uniref:Uncharacterized protein n=1 Tax=Pseudomassariella vexata TaxID=1141098 RepID=A0A1Y2DCE3_9PEZI|nr:uncharacterized protein BCR38DRAFT_450242 [Pseudomassariella vexata]ORY56867.1 hypothetical protein BCR38DRAFT_450242 [Pseudomassariella vexata]
MWMTLRCICSVCIAQKRNSSHRPCHSACHQPPTTAQLDHIIDLVARCAHRSSSSF